MSSAEIPTNPERYILEDAAQMIAKVTGKSSDEIEKMLVVDAQNGLLPIYRLGINIPVSIPKQPDRQGRPYDVYRNDQRPPAVRPFQDEAYWNDLNKWMDEQPVRTEWRFPEPQPFEETEPKAARADGNSNYPDHVNTDWKRFAWDRAKELHKENPEDNLEQIGDKVAPLVRAAGPKTQRGKYPVGSYIARHVLKGLKPRKK